MHHEGEFVGFKRPGDESSTPSNKKPKQASSFTVAERETFWRLLLEFQAEALLPDSFVELRSARYVAEC